MSVTKTNDNKKSKELWKIILPAIVILAMIITTLIYLINFSYYNQDYSIVLEASGNVDTDFRVFYIENESFPDNPVAQNLNFLMSFTDFIEIDSQFSAHFSEEVEVYYSHKAFKRLVVRYRGSAIDGEANPIVFELIYPLADTSGDLISDEMNFLVTTYTISPEQYIDIYLDFVTEQRRKEINTNRNPANFFAELSIEFIYDINIPNLGINENVARGYLLPLSTEVYSLIPFGSSSFDQSLNELNQAIQQADLPIIVVFVIIFTINTYFLFAGIKNLRNGSSAFDREIFGIFKKYSNEIINSNIPLISLFNSKDSQYILMKIDKFESILNLAINSNQNITSYYDERRAEFVVVKGEFVYYYEVENKEWLV